MNDQTREGAETMTARRYEGTSAEILDRARRANSDVLQTHVREFTDEPERGRWSR